MLAFCQFSWEFMQNHADKIIVLECHGDLDCTDVEKDGTLPIFKWIFVWPKLNLLVFQLYCRTNSKIFLPLVSLIKKGQKRQLRLKTACVILELLADHCRVLADQDLELYSYCNRRKCMLEKMKISIFYTEIHTSIPSFYLKLKSNRQTC